MFFAPTAKEEERKYSGKGRSGSVSYDERENVLVQKRKEKSDRAAIATNVSYQK